MFAFDHYVIPDANKTQDAIRNQIKGRANPDLSAIRTASGSSAPAHPRIYYYKYFDACRSVMVDVHVYELEPDTFRLKRHIFAERARWEPA